jgi:hypothetical protein
MADISQIDSNFPNVADTWTTQVAFSSTARAAQVNGLFSAISNIETVVGLRKTQGSVLFAGVSGNYTEDNANFFWDSTNKRLGIGTTSPARSLHINAAGGWRVSTSGSDGLELVQSSPNLWQLGSIGSTNLNILPQSITLLGTGPHAIGGATLSTHQLRLLGTFVGDTGLTILSRLQPVAGSDAVLFDVSGTIDEAGSGTHTDFAGTVLRPFTITAGAAALTNATTLKIAGAPSVGNNRYALWVAGGNVRVNSGGFIGALVDVTKGPSISHDAALFDFMSGTTAIRWMNQANNAERMRLTDGGILALGTTVATGAGSPSFVIANALRIRGVQADGATTLGLLDLDTNNDFVLGRDIASGKSIYLGLGAEIRWGKALVALGGGAAPTFGTIGGSGPATAAQNTWMRILDSTGAAFWVPVWK